MSESKGVPKNNEIEEEVIYRIVYNDGDPDHLMCLTAAKNVVSTQLPKMPKDYIARLIYDRNHRTMVIQQGTIIIGAICFRPFFTQRFAEIVFCAVMSVEQGKGYGRYIMAHLKEHVKTEGIDHFLTYADNYAIKYFAKQGFTKVLSMCSDRWKGWIKDYDGATLMECTISREVNYLQIHSLVAQQREKVYERIMKVSNTHCVCPSLPPSHFPCKIEQIPGVLEAGFKRQNYPTRSTNNREHLMLTGKLASMLIDLLKCKETWAFRKPVDKNVVLDYHKIITHPMDLQTMRNKLDKGEYHSLDLFTYDIKLIVDNCRTYNDASTAYYKHANDTWVIYGQLVETYFPGMKVGY